MVDRIALDSARDETSYRALLARAWPIILANAAVPTLGLVDTAIIGNFQKREYKKLLDIMRYILRHFLSSLRRYLRHNSSKK